MPYKPPDHEILARQETPDRHIEITYSSDPEHPLEDPPAPIVAALWMRNYDLGPPDQKPDDQDSALQQARDLLSDPKWIALPVYAHEHGGVVLYAQSYSERRSRNGVWIGAIALRAEDAIVAFNQPKPGEQPGEAYLKDLISRYSAYLNGASDYDVYDSPRCAHCGQADRRETCVTVWDAVDQSPETALEEYIAYNYAQTAAAPAQAA